MYDFEGVKNTGIRIGNAQLKNYKALALIETCIEDSMMIAQDVMGKAADKIREAQDRINTLERDEIKNDTDKIRSWEQIREQFCLDPKLQYSVHLHTGEISETGEPRSKSELARLKEIYPEDKQQESK